MFSELSACKPISKVLDGKLIDIKRAYKSNTFEVGLIANNSGKLPTILGEKYEISPTSFKSINNELQYNIKIPENDSVNDLINYLTTLGQLTHFVEVIPSANDIFIETVKNN